MKSKRVKFSKEALIEVFQTPRPSADAIAKWRASWRDSEHRVEVINYMNTIKFLSGIPEIDPLFYQTKTEVDPDYADESTLFVVFYKPEHEAYFKIHQNLG